MGPSKFKKTQVGMYKAQEHQRPAEFTASLAGHDHKAKESEHQNPVPATESRRRMAHANSRPIANMPPQPFQSTLHTPHAGSLRFSSSRQGSRRL